jgi:hypothetical protein
VSQDEVWSKTNHYAVRLIPALFFFFFFETQQDDSLIFGDAEKREKKGISSPISGSM